MSGDAGARATTEDHGEPRRRFRRRSDPTDGEPGGREDLAVLHAELLLLREENARLKSAQLQRGDVGRLIGRARALSSAEIDHDSMSDDTQQLLVEGLLIRESLLEICQEIERSMVAFEAKLGALAAVTTARSRVRPTTPQTERTNGHGSSAA